MTHLLPAADLIQQQTSDSPPLVIDVRSADEYAAGHVAHARHIPIDELPNRVDELPRDQPIVTYCMMAHPGRSRGERAAALLRDQGFDAVTLDGGYPAWLAAGDAAESARQETGDG